MCICVAVASLMAVTNYFTAPIITENENKKANEALLEVMPDGGSFEKIDISKYTLPATVTEAYKAKNGGYVIKLVTTGYSQGLTIMCGVTADGTVSKAICLASTETLGKEKTYGENFIGKDINGVDTVDTISNATMTTMAYRSAIKDALNAVTIFGGGEVDLRTEEEKFYANLEESLLTFLPNRGSFEKLDITAYKLPSTVTEAYKAKNGGYVVKLTTTGYKEGLTIVCGINADGTVSKAICLASNDTLGKEQTYGNNFVGKNAEGIDEVDIIAGATMTTNAYRSAIKDAINASIVFGGGSVETRTEEEIFNDNLAAALPAAEGKFTKMFITEDTNGINNIYKADNASGFVCVIGETFVGTDAQGNVTTANVAADTKVKVSNAVKAMIASSLTDIDVSAYENLPKNLVSAKKTATGNYVIETKGAGYGINGESNQWHQTSGLPIVVKVAITNDGKIIENREKISDDHHALVGYLLGDFSASVERYYPQDVYENSKLRDEGH